MKPDPSYALTSSVLPSSKTRVPDVTILTIAFFTSTWACAPAAHPALMPVSIISFSAVCAARGQLRSIVDNDENIFVLLRKTRNSNTHYVGAGSVRGRKIGDQCSRSSFGLRVLLGPERKLSFPVGGRALRRKI